MASKSKDKNGKENEKKLDDIKEPAILVRPISRLGGLDNIHVALIALVVILILLLLVISYSKPIAITNSTGTGSNCTYGSANGACAMPTHNASQIKTVAEQVLASYGSTNSSLSVLAYVSNVSKMTETYVPGAGEWLVTVPALNTANNQTFYISMIINDKDTAIVTPYYQIPLPSVISGNKVVAQGVVQIAGKPYCSTQSPLQAYWFVDPYAPGGMQGLVQMTSLNSKYAGKLNATLRILYSGYTQNIANQVGLSNAEALGEYLLCASAQSGFGNYVSAVNSLYSGSYLSPNTLQNVAQGAGINATSLDSCLGSVVTVINHQALLANFYNISSTPAVVTNCEYLSQPQAALEAACYANSTFC